MPWSLMDFYFATQQDERCASTSSQNDKLSTEGPSTNTNVNRLDETCTQASPGYTSTPSSDIRGPFSRFAAVSNPALLTPPVASNFTVRIKEKKERKKPLCPRCICKRDSDLQKKDQDIAYLSVTSGARHTQTEKASAAEEAIQEVQLLYRVGVNAGFLKRDDRVKDYLSAMKQTYHRVPSLMDEGNQWPSGSELDEWSVGPGPYGGQLILPLQDE